MNEFQELLRLLGLKGTVDVLRLIGKGKTQYKDLISIDISISTPNERLKQLLSSLLIEHHLKRTDKKEEWYEITEKGKRFVKILEQLEKLAEE